MEAAILLGLVGIGYLKNKEQKTPIDSTVIEDISKVNTGNVYDSTNYYKETNEQVKELAKENFTDSFDPDKNVFNSKKVPKRETLITDLKENFTDSVYSSISDNYIDQGDFLKNDQGISAQPFFKKAPAELDLSDTRQLDRHQGDNRLKESKRETAPFFQWEKNNNVFGNQFGEYIGDKSRYNESFNKNNELPFEQQRVSHIDSKSDLNREIKQIIADKTNIDILRSKNDQKVTYGGRVVSGKNVSEKRGNMGEFNHYDPDSFYENKDGERNFVTTGAFLKKAERPEQLLKETYRTTLNDQPIGIAGADYSDGQKRQKSRNPLKIQLPNDPIRNQGPGQFNGGSEFSRKGYRAMPNEREVTGERTYEGNLRKEVNNPNMGILDNAKKTIKETTIDSKNNGYLSNTTVNNQMGLLDGAKVTKKQTTIDSQNNGYISGGYNRLTSGYEEQRATVKETTLSEYTGNAGSVYFSGNMATDNYKNAETNPNKEIIAQGRAPTLNNTKIVNGPENMDIDIKKLNSDYMNQSENKLTHVYNSGPTTDQYDITTYKDKLDDTSIAGRIDKDLLNPFRENPYTQSLSSFAY